MDAFFNDIFLLAMLALLHLYRCYRTQGQSSPGMHRHRNCRHSVNADAKVRACGSGLLVSEAVRSRDGSLNAHASTSAGSYRQPLLLGRSRSHVACMKTAIEARPALADGRHSVPLSKCRAHTNASMYVERVHTAWDSV